MDDSRHPFFSTLKVPSPPPPPDHHYSSGMATPPLHTLASVPFKWEEQPGKPRYYTHIIVRPEPCCLELPPYMQQQPRIPKMLYPNTVLDGPGRPKFASFRFFRDSFDSSPQSGVDVLKKRKGFFGRIQNKVDRGSFGIARPEKMRRSRSFSSFSETASTHLWVQVYESLKQAMPWRSRRKSKKEGTQYFI